MPSGQELHMILSMSFSWPPLISSVLDWMCSSSVPWPSIAGLLFVFYHCNCVCHLCVQQFYYILLLHIHDGYLNWRIEKAVGARAAAAAAAAAYFTITDAVTYGQEEAAPSREPRVTV